MKTEQVDTLILGAGPSGLAAGEAILSGNRTEFDSHFDPDSLNIRSEAKAFAFA